MRSNFASRIAHICCLGWMLGTTSSDEFLELGLAWYEKALPQLSGLAKDRVEKRISDLEYGNGF